MIILKTPSKADSVERGVLGGVAILRRLWFCKRQRVVEGSDEFKYYGDTGYNCMGRYGCIVGLRYRRWLALT